MISSLSSLVGLLQDYRVDAGVFPVTRGSPRACTDLSRPGSMYVVGHEWPRGIAARDWMLTTSDPPKAQREGHRDNTDSPHAELARSLRPLRRSGLCTRDARRRW